MTPPASGATVGVVGGGQLGRMLALAGYPLGITCLFLEPLHGSPASQVARVITGDYDDPQKLEQLGAQVDVVTFELEGVPCESLVPLESGVPVRPSPAALAVAQDRRREKECFGRLGVPTAPWIPINGFEDLDAAVTTLGLPLLLKSRQGGYDGRGQALIRERSGFETAWESFGGASLIAEGVVQFDREVSLIAVRGTDGAFAAYPLVENVHRDGILRLTLAPAPGLTSRLQETAERYVCLVMEEFAYVGVLAVEFFQIGNRLVANEMAPRVHNSGHWTIEGAETSQFENHLRAILGLPIGSTVANGHSIMINLIGDLPDLPSILEVPRAALHLYGKAPRPGRKLGHVTVHGKTADDARGHALRVGMTEAEKSILER